MQTFLPQHLTMRHPVLNDAKAVADLLIAHSIAEYGEPEYSEAEVLDEWKRKGFDLNHDAWMVEDQAGQIIAYACLYKGIGDVTILPEHWGRELDQALTVTVENRLREMGGSDQQLPIKRWINGMRNEQVLLMEELGYAEERHFYRMVIDLAEAPPEPELQEGLILRPFVLGRDDRQAYEVRKACFQDSWEFNDIPFEEWIEAAVQKSTFDASLWVLAELDGKPVGHSLNVDYGDTGWIGNLAVLPDFRRQGIAKALLQHSFAEFFRRGRTKVSLGVDASNATGATLLYEAVGMRQTRYYTCFKKML
ncbi:GNAT family N-acetyltransferase [Tumebacillus lipolyticus]|uniref:GNAT family N-acetyltransferase n=1 Tax=Tumebacillus lipolyticus TaxID=1280370 RepID=A0ABW5A1L8_9BACL